VGDAVKRQIVKTKDGNMENRQRGNEATGQRVTLAGLAALAMLASLAIAPAQGQTVEWQPQHPSYRSNSQVIAEWIVNDTPEPIGVTLPILEVTYATPTNVIAEQVTFWRTDPPSTSLLNLVLWTELDNSLLVWGPAPDTTPWPWGEDLAPWASSALFFTPPPGVTFIRAWATFDVRPGETVIAGQFLQSQAELLSTPEPATLALAAAGAAAAMRRTRRV